MNEELHVILNWNNRLNIGEVFVLSVKMLKRKKHCIHKTLVSGTGRQGAVFVIPVPWPKISVELLSPSQLLR